MNQAKSLKSFSKITLDIKRSSEQYRDEKKLILAAFGDEIAKEISALEIDKNQLTISLCSVNFYNKIIHQKNYWQSEINQKLAQSKLNIFDLKVRVE